MAAAQDHPDNVIESGEPGDLSSAATDEMGGGSDAGAEDIAADDPGTGGLEGHTGRTAGGDVALGVGGQSGPTVDAPSGAASIAADDAGASRAAADVAANGSGAD
jgi:hypothetical protein